MKLSRLLRATARGLRRFRRDRRGVVAVFVALMMPVIAGFATLSIDMGYLLQAKSQLQAAADAAALGAASALDGTSSGESSATSRALALATSNSPKSAGTVLTAGDVVFGNWSTTTSTFTAAGSPTNAVRVTARRSTANGNAVNLFFSKLLNVSTKDVTATATALQSTSGGGACILATDPSASAAIQVSGTVTISMDCGIASQSTHATQSVKFNGTVNVDVTSICVAGGTQTSGTVTFLNATPSDGCTPPTDPLSSLTAPDEADDACDQTNFTISSSGGTHSLTPGVYCKGITISGSGNTINFAAGTYILKGGGLKVSGGANTLNGTGVFFYNTETTGSAVDDIDFSGSGTVNLSAPTSGTYAGVLFMMDPAITSGSKKFKVAGTVTANMDGVVYFPDHEVDWSGTASAGFTCATKIIGRTVSFGGTVNFGSGGSSCASDEVTIGGNISLRLVS
jgi:Flp pilus assembly protein TadG